MTTRRRMLIAYSMSSMETQTIVDYATSFSKYLPWDVDYVHVTHDAVMGFDFSAYDVVLHNYCVRLPVKGYASESYRAAMRAFKGLKILSIQDEYDNTGLAHEGIRDLGFHVVLTCVPKEFIEHVYPAAKFPGVLFHTVLTGYVPDDLVHRAMSLTQLRDRPVWVGYRGRDIGPRYGRLGFDKVEIGRRMKEICAARGIPADITWDEESRLYGKAWFDFLGSCRSMLGSESGSNVFDFDGSLSEQFRKETEALGKPPGYDAWLPLVAGREGLVSMGQISPRVFEAAVMRTPLILFEGRYSGAVLPDAHYIPLAKDFSNADHVLGRLDDIPALEAMADRAFRHLVASGHYSYSAFAAEVADLAEQEIAARRLPPGHDPAPVGAAVPRLTELPTREPKRLADFRYLEALAKIERLEGERDGLERQRQELRRIIKDARPMAGALLAAKSIVGALLRRF